MPWFKRQEEPKKTVSDFESRLLKANALIQEAEARLRCPVYTTIPTFAGPEAMNRFWEWVRRMISCDEYRFMIFMLRENVIERLATTSDKDAVMEYKAFLLMLSNIDRFLQEGTQQNVIEIQRSQENTEGDGASA